MRMLLRISKMVFCLLLVTMAIASASEQNPAPDPQGKSASVEGAYITLRAPLFSPLFSRFPVALVNDEPITLEEFSEALGSVHEGKVEEKTTAGKDYGKVLKRLINTKLIIQEARAMGLDELPEVKNMMDGFFMATLRTLLTEQRVKDVKADEAEVEKLYRERVKEGDPENPEAQEQARQEVLTKKKLKALTDYNKVLSKRYLTFNRELIEGLDFESENQGFQKLLKDRRVLVEVRGGKPVTVGELARALQEKFYHGAETAVKEKKINRRKLEVLEDISGKRALWLEALRKGLDKTEEFKKKVRQYENSVLFGTFLRKVVVPGITVNEEELKTYYDQRREEYSPQPYEQVREMLYGKLFNDKLNRAFEEWADKLKKAYEVKVYIPDMSR